jgi:hypothetical protein
LVVSSVSKSVDRDLVASLDGFIVPVRRYYLDVHKAGNADNIRVPQPARVVSLSQHAGSLRVAGLGRADEPGADGADIALAQAPSPLLVCICEPIAVGTRVTAIDRIRLAVLGAAILASLSGCAVLMVCGPLSPDGYTRCEPAPYAPQRRPLLFSHVQQREPGHAPAYPPINVQPARMHRQDQWITDTPHWQLGDE